MNDIRKVNNLFFDAFNAGVNSQARNWDIEQMRQITVTTMMRELMEIMKGAFPHMEFDLDGNMSVIGRLCDYE